jgi:NAD(P)-dependent dehydrogenase (short-subunit alcohol dehydrogenase family)
MSTFTGKVAVVTGAGSGIGRALALGLARRGARLALSDIDDAGLAETAERVKAFDADVHTDRLDVSDRAGFRAYADAVRGHYGVVNQVYNNAGIADSARSINEAEYDVFDRVLGVNLWGVIHGTKEFLPDLIASGDGHVVNISSLNGVMAQAGLGAYCASKFGVRGFTETLRSELLRDRLAVRVTVVHPGGVKTNIAASSLARASGGELTEDDRRRAKVYDEKLLRMAPAQAAKIILDGVAADKPRVMVGSDAKAVDRLVRFLPQTYPRLATWWERRMFAPSR